MAKSHIYNSKDKEILKNLIDYPEGLRVKTLQKLTKIPMKTLYNRLTLLINNKTIEHLNPFYRICQNQIPLSEMAKLLSSDKNIQSHKFSFKLTLIKKPEWWEKRDNRLIKLKEYNFKIGKQVKWGNNSYDQLIKDQFLVQLFPDTIYFINQKKYFNHDPYLALQEALEDTLEVLRFIEDKIRFKFFINEVPSFSVKTNHYVKLNDEIAKQCKKNNYKLEVNINNELRAWVDMSQPFGLETGNKNYGVNDMDKYKTFVTDIIKNDPLTNSELQNLVGKLTLNQSEQAKQINDFAIALNRHIPAYEGMANFTKQLVDEIKLLRQEIKEFKNGKSA